MKTISELSQIKWATEETAKAFASHVKAYLDRHEGPALSTTLLYRGLGATLNDFKALGSHGWAARGAGLLDGYFNHTDKKTFGHANIVWHAKAVQAITGNAYRDKILAQLDAGGREAILEIWAQQDSVASKPQAQENAPADADDWLNQT